MRRGEIRWYTFAPPDKRRAVLILTRDSVVEVLNELIVVPATRTIRGISTELVLTRDDSMPSTRALMDRAAANVLVPPCHCAAGCTARGTAQTASNLK